VQADQPVRAGIGGRSAFRRDAELFGDCAFGTFGRKFSEKLRACQHAGIIRDLV
jgi:hypothetical protein